MKKQLIPLLTVSLLLSGCGSLPAPREMERMALLRTMGVDRVGEDLLITVSTGPGAEKGGGPAVILAEKGASFSGAVSSLRRRGENELFFGYVDQLLLGEELARRGVGPVMDYVSRNEELSMGASLWLIRGDSGGGAVRAEGESGTEARLSALSTGEEPGATIISRTAGEVWSDLLEWGSAYAPALVVTKQEETVLRTGGYAVLKDGRLIGFLSGETARGLELLAGRPNGQVLDIELPCGQVTVVVPGAVTVCRFSQEGRLKLACRMTVRLEEYEQPLTAEEREMVRKAVERTETLRARRALDQLREWEADCLGMGQRAALSAPEQWNGWKTDWTRRFGELEPELTLRVELHG